MRASNATHWAVVGLFMLGAAAPVAAAQGAGRAQGAPYDTSMFAALKWREIGPYRGGRSVAVAGSRRRPYEYYMGTTGGGVFKTTDGGITWTPATDKSFGGTIGAIAVAESNPDIVYVGTGEYPIRGNVSHGDGVYKSTDAGKTWTHLGLKATRQIARVRVHPQNPDIVWVAAQGKVWGPSPERGIFKSTDGGKTWRKVLFRNDSTGAADLALDPTDPNIMYAGFWQAYRKPWMLSSGGPGSGMFKSTDGGETWTEITRAPGLPKGIWGNIGIAVSPANPLRVWAIIEADSGGVFRSDDAGQTWLRVNDERKLRQRAWYYTKIHADPKDTNVVYVNNVQFQRSADGGKTWKAIAAPHGDSHDLWIAPDDPQRMIEGNDGGANVSFNGGKSWTEQDYATAQFYHVTTSNEFPYQVCGAQQDNSTICIPSRSVGGITMADWYILGGCESGYIAIRPDDPDISFAGCYGGSLDRKDRETGFERAINPWPENPMGQSARDLKYRVQWTFPIVISPHDPDVLYVGSNVLFKSTNEGQSFESISPDLTRRDPGTLGPSGGPITRDQTGVETYATIFTVSESPKEKGVIWTGSDDGLVHITRDGGKRWTNVTPKGIGDFTRISIIDASPFDAGTAYLAANRFQFGDMRPMLYKTSDYGRTWRRIDRGIAPEEFTRVIRADPQRKGLLYAGTERGVWVSFDDGASWQSLKRNLPPVPVHDLAIKDGDLVAGTHGRSFWILDDLSPLRQMSPEVARKPVHLFKPRDAYRVRWSSGFGDGDRSPHPVGKNPPDGATVYYTLAKPNQEVTLELLDDDGKLIRSFTSKLDSAGIADSVRADSIKKVQADSLKALGKPVPPPDEAALAEEETPDFEELIRRGPRTPRVPNKAGLNVFAWNLRYPDATRFRNMILWAAGTSGPTVAPGRYQVRLKVGDETQTQRFAVRKDPRSKASERDIEEQVAFLLKIRDKTSEANNAVRLIRNVKHQLASRSKEARGETAARLTGASRALTQRLSAIEGEIYQVRNRSGQDPLNYPIKLNNKIAALAGVVASGDYKPTAQSYEVFRELSGELDRELAKLKAAMNTELPKVNALLAEAKLRKIIPSTAEVAEDARGQVSDDGEGGERKRW